MPDPQLDQLYRSLHIGAENELAGTTLKLWCYTGNIEDGDFYGELPYGVAAAETAPGPVNNIPHMKLETDHPAKNGSVGTAMIEQVGGPRRVIDKAYEGYLKTACETLSKTLKGAAKFTKKFGLTSVITLADVLDAYNKALDVHAVSLPKDKPNPYNRFKLGVVTLGPWVDPDSGITHKFEWCVAPASSISASTQINFEVPFRNLGRIPDATDQAEKQQDFTLAFNDAKQKKLFIACRAKATELMDAKLSGGTVKSIRSIAAAQLKDGKGVTLTKPESIKFEKLKSLFTVYYYVRSIEQMKNLVPNKDSFDLLPKAPINDLIRTVLSARDQAVLLEVIGNTPLYTSFKKQMNSHIQDCCRAVGSGYKLVTITPEKRNPLIDLTFSPNQTLDELHDAIFKPGLGGRYQGETATAYGTAVEAKPPNHVQADMAYSYSGKPLQPIDYAYDKNGETRYEPVIVFEARHSKHPFAALGCGHMFKLLTQSHSQMDSRMNTQRIRIANVQKPFTFRPPKF